MVGGSGAVNCRQGLDTAWRPCAANAAAQNHGLNR